MRTIIRINLQLMLFILLCNSTHAQWVQTSGPSGGLVLSLAVSGSNLFAGTNGSVFLSTNNGEIWSIVNSGLPNSGVSAICTSPALGGSGDTVLFVGTSDAGVYRSTDGGANWVAANNGLPHSFIYTTKYAPIRVLTSSKNNTGAPNLFVAYFESRPGGYFNGALYLSTNNGESWTPTGLGHHFVNAVVGHNGNLFAGCESNYSPDGVFRSTDNGTNWIEVDSGLTDRSVTSLAISDENLFAGTSRGVFLSTNYGTNWEALNSGLGWGGVTSLTVSESKIFSVTNTGRWLGDGFTNTGVFLLDYDHRYWKRIDTGLTEVDVTSLVVKGTNLFAGTYGCGVWRRPLSEIITSVEKSSHALPTVFNLEQNYPNPFNPSTIIKYSFPVSAGANNYSPVQLKVYDILGNEVAVLVDKEQAPGNYEVEYSGVGTGLDLSAGVYFYQLRTSTGSVTGASTGSGTVVITKKMLLMK